MTTYELPPEPPVGSRVRDREGTVWQAHNREWHRDGSSVWRVWPSLLMDHGPLTLIEPDPWPTAPLIVADMGGKRELFSRNVEGAYESSTFYVDSDTIEPLTNVVPVTVVPTAEWETLKRRIRNDVERTPKRGVAANFTAERLMYATDALGLDQ